MESSIGSKYFYFCQERESNHYYRSPLTFFLFCKANHAIIVIVTLLGIISCNNTKPSLVLPYYFISTYFEGSCSDTSSICVMEVKGLEAAEVKQTETVRVEEFCLPQKLPFLRSSQNFLRKSTINIKGTKRPKTMDFIGR